MARPNAGGSGAATPVMHKMSSSPLLALAIALAGCEAPSMRAPAAPAEVLVSASSDTGRAPEKPQGSAWGDAIAWSDWDTALRTAKAEDKSVCVVVYADWCPRCKELAPVFARPEVASAAERLIMVRQDQDKGAPWLKERLGQYGSYLPRVFFLDPNGTVREDLQSGHPRYPYFYAPLVADRLLANMRAASRR